VLLLLLLMVMVMNGDDHVLNGIASGLPSIGCGFNSGCFSEMTY